MLLLDVVAGALHQWAQRRGKKGAKKAGAVAGAPGALVAPMSWAERKAKWVNAAKAAGSVALEAARETAGAAKAAALGVASMGRWALGLAWGPHGAAMIAYAGVVGFLLIVGSAMATAEAPLVAFDAQALPGDGAAGSPMARMEPASAKRGGVEVFDMRAAFRNFTEGPKSKDVDGFVDMERAMRQSACLDSGRCQAFSLSAKEAFEWSWLHRLPERVARAWPAERREALARVGGVPPTGHGEEAAVSVFAGALITPLPLLFSLWWWAKRAKAARKSGSRVHALACHAALAEGSAKWALSAIIAFSAALSVGASYYGAAPGLAKTAEPMGSLAAAAQARPEAAWWETRTVSLAELGQRQANPLASEWSLNLGSRAPTGYASVFTALALGEDQANELDVSGLTARQAEIAKAALRAEDAQNRMAAWVLAPVSCLLFFMIFFFATLLAKDDLADAIRERKWLARIEAWAPVGRAVNESNALRRQAKGKTAGEANAKRPGGRL
jgi:hypothetical protein